MTTPTKPGMYWCSVDPDEPDDQDCIDVSLFNAIADVRGDAPFLRVVKIVCLDDMSAMVSSGDPLEVEHWGPAVELPRICP